MSILIDETTAGTQRDGKILPVVNCAILDALRTVLGLPPNNRIVSLDLSLGIHHYPRLKIETQVRETSFVGDDVTSLASSSREYKASQS